MATDKERIRMSSILYFGNDWKTDNRTSSHHIARRLAQHHDVYYVECPGLRVPRGGGRDFRRIFQKLAKFLAGSREVAPRLRVQTVLQVPLHRFALVRWLNARLIRWSIRWMMWRRSIRRPILWFVAPHMASLVGQLGESLSVYYCIDDYASLPDVNVDAVRSMDETLARKCDLVFVASDTLLATKAALNPNTYYSPHGVDVEHFGRAREPDGPVPDDVKDLGRPVVGFFGLIERWIDLDLVAYAAQHRPDWTFLMIGRVALPPAEVPQLPNLHFIGQRRYEELPDYGRLFSAAIMPFRLTKESWHANPLKLREYLAMGKPVVSVGIPEADRFADIIEVAHSREEFLACLDKVVQAPETREAVQRRIDRVASSSWEARVAEVLRVVQASLEEHDPKLDPAAAAAPTT
jgi:glycosyltransferase involved in cell wall biosynthesis